MGSLRKTLRELKISHIVTFNISIFRSVDVRAREYLFICASALTAGINGMLTPSGIKNIRCKMGTMRSRRP